MPALTGTPPQRALILTTAFNLATVAFWGNAEYLMVAMGQVGGCVCGGGGMGDKYVAEEAELPR